jgi:hypothetical protein
MVVRRSHFVNFVGQVPLLQDREMYGKDDYAEFSNEWIVFIVSYFCSDKFNLMNSNRQNWEND